MILSASSIEEAQDWYRAASVSAGVFDVDGHEAGGFAEDGDLGGGLGKAGGEVIAMSALHHVHGVGLVEERLAGAAGAVRDGSDAACGEHRSRAARRRHADRGLSAGRETAHGRPASRES